MDAIHSQNPTGPADTAKSSGHDSPEAYVEKFTKGEIDRRSALKGLMSIGVSPVAAYGLLGTALLSAPNEASAQAAQKIKSAKDNAKVLFDLVANDQVLAVLTMQPTMETAKQAIDIVYGLALKHPMLGDGKDNDFRIAMRVFEAGRLLYPNTPGLVSLFAATGKDSKTDKMTRVISGDGFISPVDKTKGFKPYGVNVGAYDLPVLGKAQPDAISVCGSFGVYGCISIGS